MHTFYVATVSHDTCSLLTQVPGAYAGFYKGWLRQHAMSAIIYNIKRHRQAKCKLEGGGGGGVPLAFHHMQAELRSLPQCHSIFPSLLVTYLPCAHTKKKSSEPKGGFVRTPLRRVREAGGARGAAAPPPPHFFGR